MENNEEKIKEKMGLCVLWLGGGKRKYLGGVQAFSTKTHTKLFSSKWREKRGENVGLIGKTKMT